MKILNLFKKIIPASNHWQGRKKFFEREDLDISERESYLQKLKFSRCLEENLDSIEKIFGKSIDLNIRRLVIGENKVKCALVTMAGLSDTRAIEEILDSIEVDLVQLQFTSKYSNEELFEILAQSVINNKETIITEHFPEVFDNLTLGSSAIFFEGVSRAIICETKGLALRNIQEPESEISLRGPREGFIENIFTNTSLLRQKIRVPHLWFQKMKIGSLSKTDVVIAYIKGLASDELIQEVTTRLKRIDIDTILGSGYIEEYIKDQPMTIFPLLERTERPDKVAASLVEGKVAILASGTPFVLVLPTTYNMLLQAPDDYYENFPIGSFIRVLRHLSFLMSVFLPGIYIAIINFHQEILPVFLLLRISSSREGVPFPVIIESLIMEGLFEVLREAGLRLPRAIGSAISIVGALVLGEAAIQAGLVSAPMVIVVAMTAIASFTTPSYPLAAAARIIRFVFIIIGGTFGLFGIQFGFLMLLIHLCSLRSFGQPYFQPFAPLIWSDLKDSIIRTYWWKMIQRPKLFSNQEPQRQKRGQKPYPPKEEKR